MTTFISRTKCRGCHPGQRTLVVRWQLCTPLQNGDPAPAEPNALRLSWFFPTCHIDGFATGRKVIPFPKAQPKVQSLADLAIRVQSLAQADSRKIRVSAPHFLERMGERGINMRLVLEVCDMAMESKTGI